MMDEKTLNLIEFPRVLERLARYAAFSASAELARNLRPTADYAEAALRQGRTREARFLLSIFSDFSVGGSRDVRPLVDLAARGGVLTPGELLDVKYTLVAARNIARVFEKRSQEFPLLSEIGALLNPPANLIETISRVISDEAVVLDNASPRLAVLRRDIKIAHDRLLARLERYLSDTKTASMLQESLITQRGGRYVLPLRAEFKGQLRSIVHDQSSSGATLFVEPLAVVELNNRWQELQLEERDEVHRILAALSDEVGKHAAPISAMVGALAELDLALMCAKYAEDLRAAEPVLEPPSAQKGARSPVIVRLYQARHPLLDPASVVPIDLEIDDKNFSLVITGPNTGGKTVTLKTVGLMAVMAQSGLQIPAVSGSSLRLFENVFADIGDEQSIEQSLSTFSGHITNIVRILKACSPRTLVLLDELGAGTDPQEGAALARAILADLVRRRVPCLVATHYPELKSFAHATPGTLNASMEFDLQTLLPTYHLLVGLPGRSNAFLVAERLGMPAEIIQSARSGMSATDLRAEDLLGEIHHQRDLMRHARKEAEKAQRENERLRRELQKRLDHIEEERLRLLEDARAAAQEEIAAVRQEIEKLQKELKKSGRDAAEMRDLHQQLADLQEEHASPLRLPEINRLEEISRLPLQVGERVRLRVLGMDGVISAVGDEDVEVQAGSLRVRARREDLQRINKSGEVKEEPSSITKKGAIVARGAVIPVHPSPGVELDLRGQRAEEALEMLEQRLEDAYLAGLPMLRIIHGKGTGKLREAVRQALRRSPRVKAWETGLDAEGGEGVTIAKIAGE